MCLQKAKSQHTWVKRFLKEIIISSDQFHWKDVISGGFAHPLSVHCQHIGVHPIFHRFYAVASFSLSNFTFVVREFQIHSSTVNIELVAEIFGTHCSTFQMPAWETFSPRRWPFHNMFQRRFFPKGKILWIFLFKLSIKVSCISE
ncbi:hypothetical protein D3C72_1721050 [compost metagenome]